MNNIQNRVPVVDTAHRPLAPCSPRRARILIQQGKAHGRHRNGIYYLTLHRTIPRESIQPASGTVRGHATPYRNQVSIGTKPARTAYIRTATLIARHHGYSTTTIQTEN